MKEKSPEILTGFKFMKCLVPRHDVREIWVYAINFKPEYRNEFKAYEL